MTNLKKILAEFDKELYKSENIDDIKQFLTTAIKEVLEEVVPEEAKLNDYGWLNCRKQVKDKINQILNK